MRNKRFVILIFGVVCVLIYAVLLYFHPQESWCDDAFWTDWGRQLALHGRYFTTVWGGGHPSYCPLYAYVLAGWISVFGFSFFKVRMLNVLLLAACYYAFTLYLVNRSLLKNLVTILLFSSLIWFLPSLFEIYNCGRIEVLCLLLGISSFIFFSKIQESASRFNIFGLFVSSFLLFATGVEGVIFAVLMCVSFSIFLRIKKIQKRTVLSYSIIGFGYISSLVSLVIITKKNNCLHQFFDTMFGFSNTLSKYYFSIRAFVKNAIHGQLASLQLSLSSDSVSEH